MYNYQQNNSENTPNNAEETKITKPPKDFWQSIRGVIKTQRQSPPIKPATRAQRNIPLSFAQEQLWLLSQLESDSGVYNIANALRFNFALNIRALEQSIQSIVKRHQILRTTFSEVDGQPVQVIWAANPSPLEVIDLHPLPPTERDSQSKQIAALEAQKPFHLTQEPGFRVKLLRLESEQYILLLSMHHIVFDGSSFNVLCRELNTLYEAFDAGKPSPLPQLPIQYADYALWQRECLTHAVGSLNYWQEQLKGNIEPLQLPIDFERTSLLNYQGASQYLQLSGDLTKALKALSGNCGVTLFTTLLAAFKTLLYIYTKQEDIILVSPVAARDRPELKNLIGYFNNLLVMRTNLGGNPTFRTLLHRVSKVVSEGREHQDIPFQQLTQFPNLAGTPLSVGMFALSNYQSERIELSGTKPRAFDIRHLRKETSNFDLSLTMDDRGSTLTGMFKYKTDLFSPATITQMGSNFQTLLETLAANPDLHLENLELISPEVETDQFWEETEAIKAALTQHPTVGETAVITREDIQHPVAYIIPAPGQTVSKEELQNFLPAVVFIILKAFPKLSTGKIDYRAMKTLPLTDTGTIDLTAIPVSQWGLSEVEERLFYPQNLTQEMLTRIWVEVLGIESLNRGKSQLNILHNFFEMGGHSLAAVRLFHRIGEVFQVQLPLQYLFDDPTIAGVARKIETQRMHQSEEKSWSPLVPIQVGGNKQPFFIIPGGAGGEGELMVYAKLIYKLGVDQPVYGLQMYSTQDKGWKEEFCCSRQVETLASKYIQEIRKVQANGPYVIGGECIGGVVAFEMAQQLMAVGEKVNLILMDTLCPLRDRKLYGFGKFISPNESMELSHAQLQRESKYHYLEIIERYKPQAYPGKITLLVSENRDRKKLALNWQHLASRGWEVREVPGDHDSYLGECVETTAANLKAYLEETKENVTTVIPKQTSIQAQEQTTQPKLKPPLRLYQNLWGAVSEQERLECVYQKAMELQGENPVVYLNLASALRKNKDFSGALASYHKAMELDPSDFRAYKHLGDIHCQLQEFSLAISSYEKALELESNNASLYCSLVNYYLKGGSQQKAEPYYQKALKLIKLNSEQPLSVYNTLARYLTNKGQTDSAIAIYRQAMKFHPDNPNAYCSLGNALKKQGNLAEAMNSYQKAISLDPSHFGAYKSLGDISCQQKQFEAAIAAYTEALKLQPDNASIYCSLGNCYKEDEEKAHREADLLLQIAHYKKAIELNPEYFPSYHNLGNLFKKQGKLTEAIAYFEKAISLNPNHVNTYRSLANIFHQQGELKSAATNYQKAIELNPKQPIKVYQNLGNILNQQQQYALAINAYQKVIELNPKPSFEVYLNLGKALNKEGKIEAAIVNFRKAIELKPKKAIIYRLLGLALRKKGNLTGAIANFRKAIKLAPKNAGFYINLGDTLKQLKQIEDAIEAYQQAIKLQPDNPVVRRKLNNALNLSKSKKINESRRSNC